MKEEMNRWGVEMLLLEQAGRFYDEAHYAEALRCAERAREGAQWLGDVGLEVRAARAEADALQILGRHGEALARYSWVLGVAQDPAHRAVMADEDIAYEVMTVFSMWAQAALRLPSMSVAELFGVLDAGERFARNLGKPTWRAGLLKRRSDVHEALGRRDEAIGCAEEGLALALRDSSAPGTTLAGHQWGLGHLLRDAGRIEEARVLYEAVRDDPRSSPHDRWAALSGLCECARLTSDAATAQSFAEEALRLAQPMGDNVVSLAFADLCDACLAQNDLPAARDAAEQYVALARRLAISETMYHACVRAADVALREGDAARARAFLDEAQPHADALDRARNRVYYRAELDRRRAELAKLEAGGSTPRTADLHPQITPARARRVPL